jgi:hypothetical protein
MQFQVWGYKVKTDLKWRGTCPYKIRDNIIILIFYNFAEDPFAIKLGMLDGKSNSFLLT